MPFLQNFPVRLVIAGLLAFIGLQIHVAMGTDNPVGIAIIYLLFVALAWAGGAFHPKLIGNAFLLALPNVFIPPAILLPLRNTLDPIPISWIIGVVMAIYSAFMVGWMLDLLRKKTGATPATPA
ncbi:MAG TPA: hypothetical protein VEI97_09515 [bacterium]|nr:hypothetical protein [bacterium]